MKPKYKVAEVKTGVVLVKGSYEYCKNWVFKNCNYNIKSDFWEDADHEGVTITIDWNEQKTKMLLNHK